MRRLTVVLRLVAMRRRIVRLTSIVESLLSGRRQRGRLRPRSEHLLARLKGSRRLW